MKLIAFSVVSYKLNRCRKFITQFTRMASTMSDCTDLNKMSCDEGTTINCNFDIAKGANTLVKEGRAEIYFPNTQEVFYNPVQEFNRDISVACLREFVKELSNPNAADAKKRSKCLTADGGVKVLEALAASGLRSIRYASEIAGIGNVVANDMSSQAFQSICRNVKFNNLEHLITPHQGDAAMLMYQHRSPLDRFHIVDLDPYGSPSIFLDAAVQSVCDGGILLVTCTDMAVLCGNGCETCYSKYGAMSLKTKSCHEMALRIVLQCIESHANRYGRHIVPMLSLSVDFYVRVIVKIYTSPVTVKHSASKLALVYMCNGCETFTLQPVGKSVPTQNGNNWKHSPANGPTLDSRCHHCGGRHQLGGPIWNSQLHEPDFVQRVLKSVEEKPEDFKTSKRIQGLLNIILEELIDVPLYYVLDRVSAVCHATCPKMMQVRSAILNANYRVSYSHALRTSIKTDAPADFIWDIIRAWVEKNPLKKEPADSDPAKVILSKERRNEICFEIHPDCNPESRRIGLTRFPLNPEKYWGPKTRAKSGACHGDPNAKSVRLQGKRKPFNEQNTCNMKQYECKRFREGKCELGDNCRYSHQTATQIVQE